MAEISLLLEIVFYFLFKPGGEHHGQALYIQPPGDGLRPSWSRRVILMTYCRHCNEGKTGQVDRIPRDFEIPIMASKCRHQEVITSWNIAQATQRFSEFIRQTIEEPLCIYGDVWLQCQTATVSPAKPRDFPLLVK